MDYDMTLTEITNKIATQIGEIAKNVSEDYDVIVCPERIFIDDYYEQKLSWLNQNASELPSLNEEEPNETLWSKTIFVVIKVGDGQRNMALSNSNASIMVLSEEDDFVVARQILDDFIAEYNFQYVDGMVQSYFNPSVVSSQDAVYTGFRALLSIRGSIIIPEDGFIFVQSIYLSVDGTNYYPIPFISYQDNLASQPDPQSFSGYYGQTMAMNRQTTETISISMYPIYYSGLSSDDDDYAQKNFYNELTKAIIGFGKNMNKKYKIAVMTNIADDSEEAGTTAPQSNLCFCDDYFVMTGRSHVQELGQLTPVSLSFTKAEEN